MKAFFQQIDRTCANIMAVAFVGIHVPMVSLLLYGMFGGFAGLGTIIATVLVATIVSTGVSIFVIFRIVQGKKLQGLPA